MKPKTFFSSIKDFITKYWYVLPLLLALLALVEVGLSLAHALVPSAAIDIWCILMLLLVLLPLTWIVLLANKKWLKCFISFLATLVIVGAWGVYLFCTSLPIFFGPDNDPFGKEHPIPAGLEYHLPLDKLITETDSCGQEYMIDPDSMVLPVDIHDTNTYLSLRNGSQGGIYTYDFYYDPLPAGEIYLKCFEVTEDIPLSEHSWPTPISKSSRVEIQPTTSFSKLVDKQEFTIHEGVWGDYYAARIEVWFKDAATKQEKKLLEKVYRVEGWER